MDDESNVNQHKEFFERTDDLKERMTKMEGIVKIQAETLKEVKETNKLLSTCHDDAQQALFGSKLHGTRGLVKTMAYIEKILTWSVISGIILWAIVQNYDKVDKVLGDNPPAKTESK